MFKCVMDPMNPEAEDPLARGLLIKGNAVYEIQNHSADTLMK